MHRRRFVAGLGVGALSLSTGCVATDGGDRQPTDDSTLTEQPNGNGEPPDSETPAAETPPVDARFPPHRDDVDDLAWYGQLSDPGNSLVLEPSASSATLPRVSLSFTLDNGTDRAFHTNFKDWGIYRWEGGRWHHVAPTMVPAPLHTLPAGESHRWSVTVDNGDLSSTFVHVQGTSDLALAALGGGTYAFAVDGWWPDQEATPTYEHKTMRAARFSLDGDPLSLVPSRAVTDVERTDDAVVVSARNEAAERADDDRPATFVLARDDSASDPRPLVTEQVYREWPLRDALAHADPDVREVRVETTTTAVPAFGVVGDRSPLAYEGRTYRIDVEDSRE